MPTTDSPTIRLSSRKSALALIQTNEVKGMLSALNPTFDFVIGCSDTVGDAILDTHLSEINGGVDAGLFTKSLEVELLAQRSRCAVHSLKDMPTNLPPGLCLGAILKRESPEDCVIFHPKYDNKDRLVSGTKATNAAPIISLATLPVGAVIGTSSLRREALVRHLYPTLTIQTIRGNIQTRLAKLQASESPYDAIIVAAAGFRRGGLAEHIGQLLDPTEFGYGVGQGSIGIEVRQDDAEMITMLQRLEHQASAQMCRAERALLHTLEGGCQISMGVNCTITEGVLTLTATLLSRNGATVIKESHMGPCQEAVKIGETLAATLLSNPLAVRLLGDASDAKRALTYGNVECPGDAAAAALEPKVATLV